MKKSFHKKFVRFTYNHIWLKRTLEYITLTLASLISAIIFVIGFKTFLAPGGEGLQTLVSGGASGFSQDISLIIQICFTKDPLSQKTIDLIYSILYFVVNVPIIILAIRGIGIRFGIFTMINVAMVSGLINFVNIESINSIILQLADFFNDNGGMLARALFAGICTGLSSAVAFKFDFSAGGIDVISYYFALRKSSSVGKYSVILNSIIVVMFSVLNVINGSPVVEGIGGLFFTIEYIFVVSLVIDSINVRNKKVQLQIITSLEMLPTLLMANVPHGATVIKGKGAYSGTDKWVIYMDISQSEVKKAVSIVKKLDPSSFVNVTNLQQVYGRFFVKTVK